MPGSGLCLGKYKPLLVFCYGDEENACIYAVYLTTANQREIRRAYLVSVMVTR